MRTSVSPLPFSEGGFAVEGKVTPMVVRARWLQRGDARLDAAYYAHKVFMAVRAVYDSGFSVKPLGDPGVTEKVFNLSRFKRVYTDDPSKGWPYLSAKEVFAFRQESERWIAKDGAPRHAEKHFVKAGWILVSCSGSVGRCVLVTRRMERFFLTHDLLRIVSTLPPGYLYAYLSSWVGQTLLTHREYGGTISHLEPQHVASIPVPLLPEGEMHAVHRQVVRAYAMREGANDLLDEAQQLLQSELSLQSLSLGGERHESRVSEFRQPEIFSVRVSELEGRLDASFHLPVVKRAIDNLREGRYPLVYLGDVANKIFIPPRFKRVYVAPEYGIPFLRPSDIVLVRRYDVRFLSRYAIPVLDQLTLHEGEVLVTTDGTVGRIGLVTKHLRGWAGSNNLGRIDSGQGINRNGYIAAFLMSPYGRCQLVRGIYGGVVDHLEEEHLAAVLLPDAPQEIQERIGRLVVRAFELKEEANEVEAEAIAYLERRLCGAAPHEAGFGEGIR